MNDFLKQSLKICSYIYWARETHTIPLEFFNLPEEGTEARQAKIEEIYLLCEVAQETKLYRKMYSSEILAKLISHDFVYEFLIPYLVRLRNQEMFDTKTEKLIYHYFVTHQEILGPLFMTLSQKKTYKRVNPASSLFIELLVSEGNSNAIDIGLIFMQDYKTIEHVETIPLDHFIKRLTETYSSFLDLQTSNDFCNL